MDKLLPYKIIFGGALEASVSDIDAPANRRISMSNIAVGMSGGIDSSVAAAILRRAGHNVIGISMQTWAHDTLPGKYSRHGCYGPSEEDDIRDAQEVADFLNIPLHVVDLREEYHSHVLEYSRQEYLLGRTPNPCIKCNRKVKFEALLEKAKSNGIDFDYFATGHYVRIECSKSSGRYLLKKGSDPRKDQSYFLFSLTQEQLSRSLFPLGEYSKDDIRIMARDFGLPTHSKSESQDFVDGGYGVLVDGQTRPGHILDAQGDILGEHRGIAFYTIGQRRGLGISAKERLFVTAIDHQENTIMVGTKSEVYGRFLTASQLNWIALDRLDHAITVAAKIRYAHHGAKATVTPVHEDKVYVEFAEPEMAITPGQAVVFYDGDTVVGGGVIDTLDTY